MKKMMREVSPVYYVTRHSPPVLQIHGDRDGTIPHKHAIHLQTTAEEVGASVEVITVKGAGHGLGGEGGYTPDLEINIQSTIRFALKQLTAETV